MKIKKVASIVRLFSVLGVFAVGIILWGHLASAATIINVTTTADEDATPGAGCSLYEAGRTIATGAAYGGCTAPGLSDNVIQLPAGTYTQTLALDLDVSTAPAAAGLMVTGIDSNSTIIDSSGLTTASYINAIEINANNVTVRNLRITGGSNVGIYGANATVEDVVIDGAKINDFYISGDNATITGVSVLLGDPSGSPNVDVTGNGATLTNITVDATNNATNRYTDGVDVTGDSATLSNITVNKVLGDGIGVYGSFASIDNANLTDIGKDGIGIYGNSPKLTNIHVTNSSTGSGIGIYGDDNEPADGSNTLLEHIFIDNVPREGIGLYEDTTPTSYLRPILNDVHVTNVTGSGYDGIGIYSNGAQLTDVYVDNIGGTGIYLSQAAVGYPVSFSNVLTDTTAESGIRIDIDDSSSVTLDHVSILNANSVLQSWQYSLYVNTYGTSPVTITNSRIDGNQASSGLYLTGDCNDQTITDTYIANNNTTHANGVNGGGIYNDCGNLSLNRVTIANNYASTGGGIYTTYDFSAGNPTAFTNLTNVTIFNNQASGMGGGLYMSDGSFGADSAVNSNYRWQNVTLAGNQATEGDTLYIYRNGETGPYPIVTNTILSAASDAQCASDETVLPFSTGSVGNISTDNSCPSITNVVSDVGLEDSLSTFSTAAQIGASNEVRRLPVLALLTGSLAIDSADSATSVNIDARNVSRPVGSGFDIGAYEWNGALPEDDTVITGPVPGAPDTGFALSTTPLSWSIGLVGLGLLIAWINKFGFSVRKG